MDDADRRLIEELLPKDEELKQLVEAHRAYETTLEEMGRRRFLSDAERQEMALLKKRKLAGKDRIHQILARWRKEMGIG
jgi:uncharacterized protein